MEGQPAAVGEREAGEHVVTGRPLRLLACMRACHSLACACRWACAEHTCFPGVVPGDAAAANSLRFVEGPRPWQLLGAGGATATGSQNISSFLVVGFSQMADEWTMVPDSPPEAACQAAAKRDGSASAPGQGVTAAPHAWNCLQITDTELLQVDVSLPESATEAAFYFGASVPADLYMYVCAVDPAEPAAGDDGDGDGDGDGDAARAPTACESDFWAVLESLRKSADPASARRYEEAVALLEEASTDARVQKEQFVPPGESPFPGRRTSDIVDDRLLMRLGESRCRPAATHGQGLPDSRSRAGGDRCRTRR